LAVYLSSGSGSVCIGVYSLANDKIAIIPQMVPEKKAKETANWLKVKLVYTSIANSILVGALACSNSNGIILSKMVKQEELSVIQSLFDGTIKIMDTKNTAYGNLVLANDKGAVVDPSFSESEVKQIAKALGVDAVSGEIAGLPYVGSLAVTTNKGTLTHPQITDEEKDLLEDVLKVPVEKGTVNCGIPYVGTGLIANSHAGVVGSLTTGPEMFIIENAIDVVQEDE
jgi:translation initiation factor 6